MEIPEMSLVDKYASMISTKNIGGEEMWNLCELVRCMEEDEPLPFIEECIITPYYINENERYELYQYEFCAEKDNGETFDEYILRMTGKSKIEEIPEDIIRIRKICFGKINEDNQSGILKKIKEYFYFLMNDEEVQREIKNIFEEFNINKIYVCIYQ